MAPYIQLGAVKTWYDERGSGEPLARLPDQRAGADCGADPPRTTAELSLG
jgi:hypothetical protein